MGFGLLVIGYLTVFGLMPSYNVYISYASVIPIASSVVLIIALRKLSQYGKLFKYALWGAYALGGIAVAGVFHEFGDIFFHIADNSLLESIYQPAIFGLKLVCVAYFNIVLLSAIHRLAVQVGTKRLAGSAKRNIYLQMTYYALAAVSIMPFATPFWNAFGMFIFLYGIVCYILNLVVIYTAYMRITLE